MSVTGSNWKFIVEDEECYLSGAIWEGFNVLRILNTKNGAKTLSEKLLF